MKHLFRAHATKAHSIAVIFLEIIQILYRLHDKEIKDLAAEAEVSPKTLRNWMYGETFNPQINTLVKVACALGYEMALVKAKIRG